MSEKNSIRFLKRESQTGQTLFMPKEKEKKQPE